MLTSIAIILLLGLLAGWLFKKIKLPSLLGMILVGVAISPYAFNLIDGKLLNISSELRQLALVIILTRAGLSLNISDLKKVGRPAVLMCFVPACIEMLGTIILAPILLKVSVLEAAIMGSVIAAVSPAVIVPRMIKLIDEGYGTGKSVPQMILAGASVDDVFVIVVFTVLTALATTGKASIGSVARVPVSIITGVFLGVGAGLLLTWFFNKVHIRDTIKILIILSFSFLLLEVENILKDYVAVSGLLAIMSLGITVKKKYDALAIRLSVKYNKLWLGAEIILFVLVGAAVDIKYVMAAGILSVAVIFGAVLFRMVGVSLSLIKTDLNRKERLFCMIAYTPKATVQAAIGAIPLSMGLDCGNAVLTVAVLSIFITATLGAIGIDNFYKKLLTQENT